jgi:putative ATPase
VQQDVERTAQDPVPLHLRNPVTGLMKNFGYGRGYQYAHDLDEKVADMQCLPDNLLDRVYYHPTEEGVEKRIKARLDEIRQAKKTIHHGGTENTEKTRSKKQNNG